MRGVETTYYYVSQLEYFRIFLIASFITWQFASFYYTKKHTLVPVINYLKNLFRWKNFR